MEQKQLALALGLPEGADDAAIHSAIESLKASKAESEQLKQERDTLVLERITKSVETAIQEKRLDASKKDQFIELGKKVGFEELAGILGAMAPQVKLSAVIGHQGGAPTGTAATYNKLSEVPSDKIMQLRNEHPDEYKRLYKAEYGIECLLEE